MARRSVTWRRDPATLERMAHVERLRLEGVSNRVIAAQLGCNETTVRRDLARNAELWLERVGQQQDVLRAEALARYEDVRLRALEAARLDEAHARAVLYTDSFTDEAGVEHHTLRDVKGMAQYRGNKSANLNVALQAAQMQAKILGIIIDKAAVTDSAGQDINLPALMQAALRAQGKAAA